MRCDISSEGHCGDLGEGPIGEPVKMLVPGPRTEGAVGSHRGGRNQEKARDTRKTGRREQTRADRAEG